MKKAKRIILVFFSLFLLGFLSELLFSCISPVTCRVKDIRVYGYTYDDYSGRKFDFILKEIKEGNTQSASQLQYFCTADDIETENIEDYIMIYYDCKINSHSFSTISSAQVLVNDLPEDKKGFIRAEVDDPVFIYSSGSDNSFCLITMCTKNLSKEAIEKKILSVDLELIFNIKGTSKKIQVKGIDTLKASDIQYKDW